MNKKNSLNTALVHGFSSHDERTGAVSYPIYQCATYRHPGLYESTGYDYTRTNNPTREELENTIAMLEGGKAGLAFASGMAAIGNLLSIFTPGDHLIVSDDLYGGTYRIFDKIYRKHGLEFDFVDTTNILEIKKHIKDNTRGIFIETPSNPMMKVSDMGAIASLGKEHGIMTIVDNTFLSPYFQTPLEFGIDVVVHSGTKFLGGHDDTLAGFLVANDDKLIEELRFAQNTVGGVLAPFDSWLILRGMKTLGIRMERQQENAIKLANWLKSRNDVERVFYVGLSEHEGHELSKRQARGFGSMISFYIKDSSRVKNILESIKVVTFAESLGGVKTLMTYPYVQTHADIPEDIRHRLGVNDRLLRISTGIEDIDDIIDDLEQAFN